MNTSEHLLSLLSKCDNLVTFKQLHAQIFKKGFETDTFILGKLILHCSLSIIEGLDYAQRLVFDSKTTDTFMYNTLIRGFSESENPNLSIDIFRKVLRSSAHFLDSFTFSFTLKGVANTRCLNVGKQIHGKAIGCGLDGHIFVGTTLVSMYAECGCLQYARRVFDEIFEPNIVAWNAMLTGYFRCGEFEGAEKVFALMPFRNLTSSNLMLAGYSKAGEMELAKKLFWGMESKNDVSWSTTIVGFAHNGCFDEAFCLFRELLRAGLRPTEVSFTGVLSACAQAGALEFGKILHGCVEKLGWNHVDSVNNAIVDTYSKCGDINMARLFFNRIPGKKDVVSWTSIIAGMAMQGYGEEAIDLFNRMQDDGVTPDAITFISVLYACSHAGLTEAGSRVFHQMTEIYGIQPQIEHYGCMVDLYGRAGQLWKAYDFVVQMPVPPNDVVWRTLLGACSFHGNIEMAQKVKARLSELDPRNSGDHVLLSNVYAASGKWKDVISVRKSLTEKKLEKNPGWSMIEVDKVMYSFTAGAKQTVIDKEANTKLKEIMSKLMIEEGYVPEVGNALHDVEDEEKEDSMTGHSEKRAVAFAIARLANKRPIRVIKNLRMCKDCHMFMKLISKVYKQELLVRDRSRFHNFKNGSCSCGDYCLECIEVEAALLALIEVYELDTSVLFPQNKGILIKYMKARVYQERVSKYQTMIHFNIIIIVLINSLLLSAPPPSAAAGDPIPAPTPWPLQFHSILFVNYSGALSLIDLWYDWPNGRNFNIIQDQLGKLLYDLEWTNGTSFFYKLDSSRECQSAEVGVGILRPNWLEGGNYLGQEYVDGFLCNVWEKAEFLWYYEDVVTKRPVHWTFYTGRSIHVMTFEVGAVLEDAKWQAPEYCFGDETLKKTTAHELHKTDNIGLIDELVEQRRLDGLLGGLSMVSGLYSSMDIAGTRFPVRHKKLSVDIQGNKTDIIICLAKIVSW
ncbi:hypothetical protein Leryth_008848 [Lithospermum erythrorhizon]|nr:hypothetical protein Leryth_008848 [Lithospermum erythrorhizon]